MISQIAWKVARAFTAGRSGAPKEFAEVENELQSLTTSLDQLAEALEEDAGLLAAANDKTKAGVSKVLICCRQTLQDLDSFVLRYQIIRKPDPGANPVEQASERGWKTMLLRNWRTIWWTTEGGSIQTLREILQMHVSSITLTMQALQRYRDLFNCCSSDRQWRHCPITQQAFADSALLQQIALAAGKDTCPNGCPSRGSARPYGREDE